MADEALFLILVNPTKKRLKEVRREGEKRENDDRILVRIQLNACLLLTRGKKTQPIFSKKEKCSGVKPISSFLLGLFEGEKKRNLKLRRETSMIYRA